MFGRKNRSSGKYAVPSGRDDGLERAEVFKIEFDMMTKGSVYRRRSGEEIRQMGVTVDGATRLVTRGDLVDRKTYDALLRVDALRINEREKQHEEAPEGPPADPAPPKKKSKKRHGGKSAV